MASKSVSRAVRDAATARPSTRCRSMRSSAPPSWATSSRSAPSVSARLTRSVLSSSRRSIAGRLRSSNRTRSISSPGSSESEARFVRATAVSTMESTPCERLCSELQVSCSRTSARRRASSRRSPSVPMPSSARSRSWTRSVVAGSARMRNCAWSSCSARRSASSASRPVMNRRVSRDASRKSSRASTSEADRASNERSSCATARIRSIVESMRAKSVSARRSSAVIPAWVSTPRMRSTSRLISAKARCSSLDLTSIGTRPSVTSSCRALSPRSDRPPTAASTRSRPAISAETSRSRATMPKRRGDTVSFMPICPARGARGHARCRPRGPPDTATPDHDP